MWFFTEEERQLQKTCRDFARAELAPVAEKLDTQEKFNLKAFKGMGELGVLGITADPEYGGAGLGATAATIVMEEFGKADPGSTLSYLAHSILCVNNIDKNASAAQKEKYLPKLISGEHIGCMGMSEPGYGSDAVGMQTKAVKHGEHYLINGAKMWITNGNLAHIAIVWAQTEDGIQGFIVPTDSKGFTAQEIHKKMSLRASVTSALFFDNVRIPDSQRLPNVKGLKGPLGCLTQARYGITWGPIGAAQACLTEVVNYTKERILFGRPVAATQSAQIKMAGMARRITLAQLLSLQLGRLKDAGRMQPTQVSLAKWNNVRMALDIAREARDLLGGSGVTTEYCPIRHALNLESVITYEGTETVHQLVVGRELSGINAF